MHESSTVLDPKVKVIVFDHDDTLVETIKPKWAQHKYIAKEFYSRDLTDTELKEHWGKPLTVLLKCLYETTHIDIAMSYNIATREMFPKRLLKGTIETLKALKTNGLKLAIVTSTTKSSLLNDFKTLGIEEQIFDYIQTEDDTTLHKPDPRVLDPVKAWSDSINISVDEVVCIGDHLNDKHAADGAGFKFIGVGTGLITPDEFKKEGIPFIHKLPDLLN